VQIPTMLFTKIARSVSLIVLTVLSKDSEKGWQKSFFI